MSSELNDALEKVSEYVGCGDNSCLFVRPRGMATNGGCRCRDRPFVIAALAALFKAVKRDIGKPEP